MVVLALWTSALVISAIGHGFLLVILGIIVFVFISPGGSDIGQYPVQEIKKGLLPAAVSMSVVGFVSNIAIVTYWIVIRSQSPAVTGAILYSRRLAALSASGILSLMLMGANILWAVQFSETAKVVNSVDRARPKTGVSTGLAPLSDAAAGLSIFCAGLAFFGVVFATLQMVKIYRQRRREQQTQEQQMAQFNP